MSNLLVFDDISLADPGPAADNRVGDLYVIGDGHIVEDDAVSDGDVCTDLAVAAN